MASFGAFQYNSANPDPKTLNPGEPYKFSPSTAMRDYTDALFTFSVKILQSVSSRIDDAIKWKNFSEMLVANIGNEDMDAIRQYRKDRSRTVLK